MTYPECQYIDANLGTKSQVGMHLLYNLPNSGDCFIFCFPHLVLKLLKVRPTTQLVCSCLLQQDLIPESISFNTSHRGTRDCTAIVMMSSKNITTTFDLHHSEATTDMMTGRGQKAGYSVSIEQAIFLQSIQIACT